MISNALSKLQTVLCGYEAIVVRLFFHAIILATEIHFLASSEPKLGLQGEATKRLNICGTPWRSIIRLAFKFSGPSRLVDVKAMSMKSQRSSFMISPFLIRISPLKYLAEDSGLSSCGSSRS